jgi:DNA-binding transcriptional LysR family regulator
MELRHLRYFLVVARQENFGRASKILGIAQPALSRQIRQLEVEIGVDLFDRLPRGVKLSQAGKAYAEEATSILAHVDRANRRVRDMAEGRSGRIRLGYNDVASWHDSISRTIHAFRQSWPDIGMDFAPLSSVEQIRALHDRTLDAAIVYDLYCSPDDLLALNALTISSSNIKLAVYGSHRLARAKRVRIADLSGERLVWPSRDVTQKYYDALLQRCVESGFSPVIFQEASTLSIQLSLVSAGMALGLVGSEVLLHTPHNVLIKDIVDLDVSFRLVLAWRKDNTSSALTRFVESFRKTTA